MLVLLVGDTHVTAPLRPALRSGGWAVDSVAITPLGAADCGSRPPDVVLLDVDGVGGGAAAGSACHRLRPRRPRLPILGLSARDTSADRVAGLRAGLDDWIPRHAPVPEVIARVTAVVRRARDGGRGGLERPASAGFVEHGPLELDLGRRVARFGGRVLPLSPKEFDLLALLASEPGVVFSRKRIRTGVWRDPAAVPGRAIDTHIATLRAKLGAAESVVTVHGVGFRLGSLRRE